MTKKLKEMLKRAEHWPEGAQEEAIASLQAIEDELIGLYELSPEDRAALERIGKGPVSVRKRRTGEQSAWA